MTRKINTYGLNISLKDLRETAWATTNYPNGGYSPEYDEVFYDCESGEVWSIYQYSIGHNSYTRYHDPAIIKIGNYTHHVTQQQLMDAIKRVVDDRDAAQRWLEQTRGE